MRLLLGTAVSVALLAEPALAQDRVELAPVSGWVMSYDDDSCTLKRQFGEEGRQVYLELRQFGPSSTMEVTVASKDFRLKEGAYTAAFLPLDREPLELDGFNVDLTDGYRGKLFSYSLGQGDPRIDAAQREFAATAPGMTDEGRALFLRSLDLDPESPGRRRLSQDATYREASAAFYLAFERSETWQNLRNTQEAEAEGLLLKGAFAKPLFLRTGSLHPPMEAMRTCLDDLLSHWGIDADAHKTLSREAAPLDYARIAQGMHKTYSSEMVRMGMQAKLRVRLDVGADGVPTGCHMQVEYNEDDFERRACAKLMQDARFSPALDKDGRPIPSYWQTSIVYRLGH